MKTAQVLGACPSLFERRPDDCAKYALREKNLAKIGPLNEELPAAVSTAHAFSVAEAFALVGQNPETADVQVDFSIAHVDDSLATALFAIGTSTSMPTLT